MVPIKITDKKYIWTNYLSKLMFLYLIKAMGVYIFIIFMKKKKIKMIKKLMKIEKLNNSFRIIAKVWTEFNIPDLTKNTHTQSNVEIDKITTQEVNIDLFLKLKYNVLMVSASQGIRDTFSTGSQNQNPPHPSS